MPKEEIKQCLQCEKPLGAESVDMDWRVCHEHRKCTVCGSLLNRGEIHNAHLTVLDELQSDVNKGKEVKDLLATYLTHSRCQLATSARKNGEQDPSVLVKQSYLDWLNNFRLLCEPQADLSPETNQQQSDLQTRILLTSMSLEEKFLFLSRMEAAVAHVSIAIKADSKAIKAKIDEREAKKFKEATKQAAVSGRPTSKPENDEKEILIAEFAKKNDLSDVVARKIWSERTKSIKSLSPMLGEKAATEFVDNELRKQGRIK